MIERNGQQSIFWRGGRYLLVGSVVAYLLRVMFQGVTTPSSEFPMNVRILQLMPCFYEQLLFVLSFSCAIVDGTLSYRAWGKKNPFLIRAIAGILTSMTFIAVNATLAIAIPGLMDRIIPSDGSVLKGLQSRMNNMGKNHPLYPKFTLFEATEKYLSSGEISTYLDNEGKSKEFVPSEKQIATRVHFERMKEAASQFLRQAVILSALLCSAVLFGAVGPTRLAKPPNQAL